MTHRHRFVLCRHEIPVHTTPDLIGVMAYLWGRDVKDGLVVYDGERPVPVDDPDLTAWQNRRWPEG